MIDIYNLRSRYKNNVSKVQFPEFDSERDLSYFILGMQAVECLFTDLTGIDFNFSINPLLNE